MKIILIIIFVLFPDTVEHDPNWFYIVDDDKHRLFGGYLEGEILKVTLMYAPLYDKESWSELGEDDRVLDTELEQAILTNFLN